MPNQNHLDAIALLKADHRKVEDLFAQLEAAKGAGKKQALVQNICTELSAHTVIEEEIFYPACRGKVEEGLPNPGEVMSGNQGVKISDDQNSLKAGLRGPTLGWRTFISEKRSPTSIKSAFLSGLSMRVALLRMVYSRSMRICPT
jgi:hypothetical protein